MRIYLSHYSLNMLHNSSHQWACKMMGIQPPNNIYFEGGNQGQRIIQEHVSGKNKSDELKNLTYTFPVVEEVKFDEKTKFVKQIRRKGDYYIVQGFADGLDPENKRMLEIKLSSSPWSATKFQKSMQRKLYAWGFPHLDEAIIVTGEMLPKPKMKEARQSGDWKAWSTDIWRGNILHHWKNKPLQQSSCPMTKEDREEAEEWLMKGIEILEKGDFSGGLNEEGVCDDPFCGFGENCYFKVKQTSLL